MRELTIELTGPVIGSTTIGYEDTDESIEAYIFTSIPVNAQTIVDNASIINTVVSKETLLGINTGYSLAGRSISEVLDDLLFPINVSMTRTMLNTGLNVQYKTQVSGNYFITVLSGTDGFFRDIEFSVRSGKMINDEYYIKVYRDGELAVSDELDPPNASYDGYYLHANPFINPTGSCDNCYTIPVNIPSSEKINRIMSEYTDELVEIRVEIESRFNNIYRNNFYLGRGVVIYSIYTNSSINSSDYSTVLNNKEFGFKSNLAVLKHITELVLTNDSGEYKRLYLFIPSIFGKALIFKNKTDEAEVDMTLLDQNTHIDAFTAYGYNDQHTNNIAFSGDFDVYISTYGLESINLIIKR